VIDVQMLYYRTDAHPSSFNRQRVAKDCLHYCMPGPLDVIPRLIHHAIVERA
jgi:hypothetical protein